MVAPALLFWKWTIALLLVVMILPVRAQHDSVKIKELDKVTVTGNNPNTRVRAVLMGTEEISAAEARKLPAILGETDILKILQMKTGVKNAGEGLSGMYVRGGSADQNLMLFDGVPIYNANHLMSLFSTFNNEAISRAVLYKSSYPAKYGGRLSSVIEVQSRQGSMDSMSVSGGIGMLSSRVSIESPLQKGRSSIIVSGRRTYFDLITKTINKANKGKEDYQQIPDYFFNDFNVRADWKINNSNTVWVTGFIGKDHFHSLADDFAASLIWGNKSASLNWKSLMKNNTELLTSVFHSRYDYHLDNQQGLNNFQLRSGIQSTGARFMASFRGTKKLRWQTGLDGMQHQLHVGDFSSTSELSTYQVGERLHGNEWGAYVNGDWDNGEKLALSGGVRMSGFNVNKRWYVRAEPRVSARMLISETGSVRFSFTRMSQYLHLASLSSASLPVDMWYPSTERTKPQYADQLSAGFSQSLFGNNFYFSTEVYHKWMYNQVEFMDGANVYGNPRLENDFVYGKGKAYGLETIIEKKTGRTTGWVGYTLSWATRAFADIDGGRSFKPRYDRRHDISMVVSHKISRKFSTSANWVYGSGAYTTLPVGRFMFQDQIGRGLRSIIPVYEQRGNYRLPPMHRLDLNLTMQLRSKKGAQELVLNLYNAYSRRNPFYIQFKEVSNKEGYVTAIEPTLISLFPLLPGLSYNFRF